MYLDVNTKRAAYEKPDPVRDIVRLQPAQLASLEKLLPKAMPNGDASPQYVGYLLGIQHALTVLRQGWSVDA